MDNIKSWEQKYVFRAPFDDKVHFLKFYNENQFVQTGEQVFTIVQKEEKAFGQVVLPAQGSDKIKTGQGSNWQIRQLSIYGEWLYYSLD